MPNLRARAGEPYRLEQIVGECPKIVELRQMLKPLPHRRPRVDPGESGTGKDWLLVRCTA